MSILQSFIAGQEARRAADAAEQVNRMQQFLSQNGQAIFAGDQNALGALAGMGPQGLETAMNLRNAQEEHAARQAAQERQSVLAGREDQQWQWKVEEYAASKTAAERAAEAAEIEQGTKMALMAETPEQFDQIVTQAGMPEYVGMFDQRETLAARFMTVAEILKRGEADAGPEGFQTLRLRAQEAGLQPGTPEYADFMARGGARSEPLVSVDMGQNNDGTAWGEPPKDMIWLRDAQGQVVTEPDPSGRGLRPIAVPIGGTDAAVDRAAAADKNARKDSQGRLKLGTTLESLNLNIAEIENGGLPVAGAWGDLRRSAIGRIFTGDSAFNFGNRTNQITDSAALAEVQNMRDNSPTGGAVGSLTDDERRAIGNAVTALNSSTSADEYLRAAKAFRKLSLDLAYGEGNWTLGPDGQPQLAEQALETTIPEGAIDLLKQNDTPDYRRSFDEIFGEGAAARVLGGN